MIDWLLFEKDTIKTITLMNRSLIGVIKENHF